MPHHLTPLPPPTHTHTHTHTQDSGGEIDLDQSSEILTFHTAIDNLVESEEHLVTEHKAIIQADQYLLEEEKQLLEYVDDVNHDIEQYVVHVERIISQKVERLSKFKGEMGRAQHGKITQWDHLIRSQMTMNEALGRDNCNSVYPLPIHN